MIRRTDRYARACQKGDTSQTPADQTARATARPHLTSNNESWGSCSRRLHGQCGSARCRVHRRTRRWRSQSPPPLHPHAPSRLYRRGPRGSACSPVRSAGRHRSGDPTPFGSHPMGQPGSASDRIKAERGVRTAADGCRPTSGAARCGIARMTRSGDIVGLPNPRTSEERYRDVHRSGPRCGPSTVGPAGQEHRIPAAVTAGTGTTQRA